jgi:hypothetical protein
VQVGLADGNGGVYRVAGVADDGLVGDAGAPFDALSQAAQVRRQAHVLAVVGFDHHQDAVVLVGVVAPRERYLALLERRVDDVPKVRGIVDGELVVRVDPLLAPAVVLS